MTYTYCGTHLLMTYGSDGELPLFHQLTLGITMFIKWSARIAENMDIILLVLQYKGLSIYPQIRDVVVSKPAGRVWFLTEFSKLKQYGVCHCLVPVNKHER